MANKPINELDFDRIKANLKTFLQSQEQLQDYDYDSSVMSVLLDVLAYNTFMSSFHTNMAYGEMFLDSSQTRESVISHAKTLNYLPQSYRSAKGVITLTFNPDDDPAFITVPKYTKFSAPIDGVTYTFATRESYTLRPQGSAYQLANVEIFEGRVEKEYFQVRSLNDRFIISNKKVDTGSIDVVVYASNTVGAASNEYTFKDNLFGVGSTDKVFYLQPANEDQYEVVFGGDVFGKQVGIGQLIEITYQITRGEEPNGAATFTSDSTIGGYTPTVAVTSAAAGGAKSESIASIKFNAPKAIQIQDRAVTSNDYKILLMSKFSEIQSVSVYGGETLDPPQYGKVVVAVDVSNSDGASENAKRSYQKYLNDRSPLSIRPVVISPKFMYVEVVSTIFYDTTVTDKSVGDIETIAHQAISDYSTTYLSDFGKDVRHSRIVRAIDDADDGIVSNDTKLRIVVDLNPQLNTNTSYTIEMGNKLEQGHPLNFDEDITVHTPAIKSSPFTYNGTSAFIQDNGLGALHIITTTTENNIAGFELVYSNIGSVNYETGKVIISNLNVDQIDGSAIKVYGRGVVQDILGPDDRIISIRDSDVSLTVEAID